MRPTAKDLAAAAGLSLATVDRVLNGRENVSRRAIQKVNDAIERIGFVRNPAAVNLARARVYNFQFILPEKGGEFLKELMRQVTAADAALKAELVDVKVVQIDTKDPNRISSYLSSLERNDVDGVAIMAPESPQVRDAMARLLERGIRVVQFLTGQEKLERADFVGIDNFAAGATAGRLVGRFTPHVTGKVMVLTDTMMAQDSIERRLGFDSVINRKFPNLKALPSLETYGDRQRARDIVSATLQHNRDVCAAYVASAEARIGVETVAELADIGALTVVAHERTRFTEAALRNEEIDAVIAQNPGHAVRSTIRILRARVESRKPLADQEKIRIEIWLKENL